MNKKYFKYISILFFVIILCITNRIYASESSSGYTIKSYDIDMVVNENNTFDITENIEVYFSTSKHRNI